MQSIANFFEEIENSRQVERQKTVEKIDHTSNNQVQKIDHSSNNQKNLSPGKNIFLNDRNQIQNHYSREKRDENNFAPE